MQNTCTTTSNSSQ